MAETPGGREAFEGLLRNKKVLFAGAAALGGVVSATVTAMVIDTGSALASWAVAGAFDAVFIGSAVVYAQNYYQTKSFGITAGLKRTARDGAIAGFIGGCVALTAMSMFGAGEFGRVLGWAISGAVAGHVVAAQVPNLKASSARYAGGAGGALGCLLMNMGLGYTFGVAVTGAAIGLMVAMAEVMFRKNWIDVELYAAPLGSGLNLAKPVHQFTLSVGQDPITIGTGAAQDIRLQPRDGAAPAHLASIYVVGDKTVLHDLVTSAKTELSAGQPFRLAECQLRLGA